MVSCILLYYRQSYTPYEEDDQPEYEVMFKFELKTPLQGFEICAKLRAVDRDNKSMHLQVPGHVLPRLPASSIEAREDGSHVFNFLPFTIRDPGSCRLILDIQSTKDSVQLSTDTFHFSGVRLAQWLTNTWFSYLVDHRSAKNSVARLAE